MAQEINEAMGGLYSELAQSFQRLVVNRFVALHEASDKSLPRLPPNLFRVAVITGVEAMGRSLESKNLLEALSAGMGLGKEEVGRRTKWGNVMQRLYDGAGINADDILMSEDEAAQAMDAMKQDAMKAEMISKGTGPAVTALGGAATQGMAAQMANSAQGGPTPPGTQGTGTPTGAEPPPQQ